MITKRRRRRSVKYRTTELNFPTDFIQAAQCRRATLCPFIGGRVIGTFYHASDRARRADHRRGEGTTRVVGLTVGIIRHRPLSHWSRDQHNIALVSTSVAPMPIYTANAIAAWRLQQMLLLLQPARVRAWRSHREIGRAYRC